MARGNIRDTQIANLIQEEVDLILTAAEDQRLSQLKVSGIEPKRGGGHFVVLISRTNDAEGPLAIGEIAALLERAAGYIRYELGVALNLKRVPQISLVPDPRFFADEN